MRYRSLKKFFSLWAVLLIALVIPAAGSAKSLYMLANHHINQFDAWNINPDGTVTYQATYNLSFVQEPSGMGVDADSATLFITDEFNVPGNDPAIELVNAVSMRSLGKVVVLDASGKPVRNLAGIDVDDKNNIVYIVKRNTPDIYVYDWDPNYINAQDPDNVIVDARAMRLRAGYPKALAGVSGMFGIALDEREGVLYVADSKGKMVKGFDTNTWNEVLSYKPSIVPCGIAVDRRRKIIYTTAPDLAKEECCFGLRNLFGRDGFTIISKYDITTGSETIMDMRKVGLDHGGMGLGVDEITGYLYVTGGCTGDDLTIWDPNPANPPAPDIPFTLVHNTGIIGNPAALSIGNISYNPLNLKIPESECVNAGEEMTYSICYGSEEKKDFDVTNIKIVDNLPDPSKVSFISATDGGVYDPATNTVTWHLGDLPGGSPPRCVQVTVLVNPALPQMEYITNFATITSDQTPPTTVADERRICCLPYCPTPSDITINKITEECKAQVFWPEPDFGVCGPVTVISNHKPGDLFPIECGATGPIVTYTAQDVDGIVAECTFTLPIVNDGPSIEYCPTNIPPQDNEPGKCGARVDWTPPKFVDDCSLKVTSTHNPGSFFEVGTTEVTYEAVDNCGIPISCTFTVTVKDSELSLCIAKDITVQLDASGKAIINPQDVDNGSSDNCGIAKMEVFPDTFTCDNIGPNLVILTVTDTSGNQSTCTATVTVVDPIPPEARCKNITVQLDASGQVSINPQDVDNGSADNCGIAKMEVFPDTFTCDNIGPNLVTLTVIDTSGNQSTCTATVTVVDKIAPILISDCPGNINVSGICGKESPVSWTPPVFKDNCQVIVTSIAIYPDGTKRENVVPGDSFPVGTTKVIYTAKDSSGNEAAPCEFNITVEGGGIGLITPIEPCPPDITVNNQAGECGAKVFWIPPTFVGDCGPVTVTSTHNPGDFFPAECESEAKGTIVTYTARDEYGNEASCSFRVIVLDKEAPMVSGCPDDITVSADPEACGAKVFWIPQTFRDNCGSVTVTSNHEPGDFFPIGTTKVIYTATDDCGNKQECSFTVTVSDTIGPMIINGCPTDITVRNEPGVCGAKVSWTPPVFSDNCGPVTVESTHKPGDFFPAECKDSAQGTLVTYTATDSYGNTATCSFKVTVLDEESPSVTIKPLAVKYFTTDIVALDYTVIDNCDPDPEVVVKLSNNGAAPIYLSPHPPISLNMAELVGQNTITVVATDECGNVGSASVQFEVVLRLTGDQLVIKDEIQKIGATTFVAFIHFPSPYDALTIYEAVADGAVADQINHDWVEHTSICRFNRSKVTEVPIDDYFEVNGLFKYRGISCKFFGADYIYRVLPPPRTPVPPPGQSPINPPIKQSTQQSAQPAQQPAQQAQQPAQPAQPAQQTVQPAIQQPGQQQLEQPAQQPVQQPVAQSTQQTSTVPAQPAQLAQQQPAQQTVQPAMQSVKQSTVK
ncbi:MAG: HYR domain-containing protein [bacterium]|nr:HYR domain-containing protein [bacterium]